MNRLTTSLLILLGVTVIIAGYKAENPGANGFKGGLRLEAKPTEISLSKAESVAIEIHFLDDGRNYYVRYTLTGGEMRLSPGAEYVQIPSETGKTLFIPNRSSYTAHYYPEKLEEGVESRHDVIRIEVKNQATGAEYSGEVTVKINK